MKTLAQHLEDQLTANIVRSEINKGRSVYLVQIKGTERTMVTSQPAIWGGEKVDGGIGAIASDGNGTWKDEYSAPIDEINSLEMLKEWKEVDQKVSKSNVMKEAHKIAKTLQGDYSARLSEALKLAWKKVR